MAAILSRTIKTKDSKIWKGLTRNLFYVYLFYEPLEYLGFEFVFRESQLFTTGLGYYFYFFMRTVGVFVLSLVLGEGKRAMGNRIKEFLK